MGRELKVQMEGVLENQAMARAIAAAYAAEMDPTVDELTEIKTAVSEAFSNAAIPVSYTHLLYGRVICRCEQITESEIIQAIRRPVGARTVDAVKRRVRAGMGLCQGGFCSPLVIEILARELGISPQEVRKRSGKSYMLTE